MSRQKKPKALRAEQLPDGTPIWYSPIIGHGPEYSGVVDGECRELCGSTVVNLRDMDPNYEHAAKRGNRVLAACLEALRLR